MKTPEELRDQVSSGEARRRWCVLGITRKDVDSDVSVTTEPSPDDPKRAVIGIAPRLGYDSDVTVKIQLDNVGGPSAGLMFALGIYDKLTPGPLNGGLHIAGTGTMAADGTVGPIGGIQQKMIAARSDGATVFFVPEGQLHGGRPGGARRAAAGARRLVARGHRRPRGAGQGRRRGDGSDLPAS